MIIEVKNEGFYHPKFNGNRDLPEAEQIKIIHRFLLPGERKTYLHTEPIKMDIGTGKVNTNVNYIQDEQGITKAILTGIENLKISVDGKEKVIKTALDLYNNPVPNSLVTEIEIYLLNVSPEVDKDFL